MRTEETYKVRMLVEPGEDGGDGIKVLDVRIYLTLGEYDLVSDLAKRKLVFVLFADVMFGTENVFSGTKIG